MSASAIRIPFLWRQTWTRWRRTQSACPTTMSTPPAPPPGRRSWQVRLFPVLSNASNEYNRNSETALMMSSFLETQAHLRFSWGSVRGSVMARHRTNSDVWIHHVACKFLEIFHKAPTPNLYWETIIDFKWQKQGSLSSFRPPTGRGLNRFAWKF